MILTLPEADKGADVGLDAVPFGEVSVGIS
jgi:hypothetical protein